jgi:DNA-directed RNA polymerase subunit RPC12/RpoP
MIKKILVGDIKEEVKKVRFKCYDFAGNVKMRCIKCNAKIDEFIDSQAWFLGIKCKACGQEYLYVVQPPKVFPVRECKITLYAWRRLSRRKVGTWRMRKRKLR